MGLYGLNFSKFKNEKVYFKKFVSIPKFLRQKVVIDKKPAQKVRIFFVWACMGWIFRNEKINNSASDPKLFSQNIVIDKQLAQNIMILFCKKEYGWKYLWFYRVSRNKLG